MSRSSIAVISGRSVLCMIVAASVLACGVAAQAEVVIETVTVGNPGNDVESRNGWIFRPGYDRDGTFDRVSGEVYAGQPPGACCREGICTDGITEIDCSADNGQWFANRTCEEVTCSPPAPPNDECTDCAPVHTNVPYNGTSAGADGTDVTSCTLGDALDVWHCWTADCTGVATFNLCNSSYDTSLAIFDACDGNELACIDDNCALTRSQLDLFVTEGTAYYIRVSGFHGDTGDYTLTVEPCSAETVACCVPSGLCGVATEQNCLGIGGTPLDPGLSCRGDWNGNGVDDACEPCPDATIIDASPPNGTVDARQPHSSNDSLLGQGIGSPGEAGAQREPIIISLDPPIGGGEDCFELCETAADPAPNAIAAVTYLGGGLYEIVLDRPITVHAVTTIQYQVDGSFVEYTSHPANINGADQAVPGEVLELIDCCLDDVCTPTWGNHSCDIDHSEQATPTDILRVIDLLNGADLFDAWNGTALPANTPCP